MRLASARRVGRSPLWASALAGAGAGCAAIAFLAISWPADLLAVPSLLAWIVLITALSGTRDRPVFLRLLVVALIIGVTLGVAGAVLLVSVP